MKFVTIGRHRFTPIQEELLRKAGLKEEVHRFEQVENINEVVAKVKELGAAIIVQALPMHLLAQLLAAANRSGVDVYSFKIEAVAVVKPEEAEEKAKELNADIIVPDPRSGNVRLSRTVALQRLKRIVVEAEDVVFA